MDIYKFINSKDIKEYLKEINYEFSVEEMLYFITHSKFTTLKERQVALEELKNTYPDFVLKKISDLDEITLSEYVAKLIEIQNEYIEMFFNNKTNKNLNIGEKARYYPSFLFSDGWGKFVLDKGYTTFNDAFNSYYEACPNCGCPADIVKTMIYKGKYSTEVGSTIILGSYPQGTCGGVKPIEWEVLSVENNQALIISKYGLDCKPFNTSWTDVTWEACSLRQWLNNDFYNKAFSEEDKSKIILSTVTADKNPDYITNQGNNTKDKVFLLSIAEVNKYFSNDENRNCIPTEYAKKQGVYTDKDYIKNGKPTCWWWLRSSGDHGNRASHVERDGDVCIIGSFVDNSLISVRPVLKINL